MLSLVLWGVRRHGDSRSVVVARTLKKGAGRMLQMFRWPTGGQQKRFPFNLQDDPFNLITLDNFHFAVFGRPLLTG